MMKHLVPALLASLGLPACERHGDLPFVSLEAPLEAPEAVSPRYPELLVGVAPVVSGITSYEFHAPMVEFLGEHMDRKATFVHRGTYHEMNEMLRRGDIQLSFTCAGPWLLNGKGLEVLVVPVVDGYASYRAVCITAANSDVESVADLEGRPFGFTDPLSFTGRAYMRARLANMGLEAETFFSESVTVEGHDVLMELVASGEVAGACVSSLIFDNMEQNEPEVWQSVRAFERSQPFGPPPVLTSKETDPLLKNHLRLVLTGMHADDEGRAILDVLDVDRFAIPPDDLYTDARTFLAPLIAESQH